jgi:hypothetical protein
VATVARMAYRVRDSVGGDQVGADQEAVDDWPVPDDQQEEIDPPIAWHPEEDLPTPLPNPSGHRARRVVRRTQSPDPP